MTKEVLRLAIPNIISNISVPLLSSVDTALMGQLSALHIGAVGVGSMIFNFIYWNFGFLRMGTTGITAQAYGQQSDKAVLLTLGRAMLIAIALAILIILLQVPFARLSFYLMNLSEAQLPLVAEYFYIRIWAAPATLGLYALMGWYFGMQNAVYPLILTVTINVINILASFFFIKYLGFEVAGVAYGTVIAQYVGLLLAIVLFFYKYRHLLPNLTQAGLLQWQELQQFLSINGDIFIRTFCLTFAFGFFYSQSSVGGEQLLAINVILLQFLNWMSYGIDGFAFASESLVGKYFGAKQPTQLKTAIRLSFSMAMGLGGLYSLVYFVFGPAIVGIFSNQSSVVSATQPYLIWMVIFPILSTPCYIWDGIFIGLTASKAMRDSMLVALVIYLAVHFLVKTPLGNHGLWFALLVFMMARGGIQWFIFWRRDLGAVKNTT
ncbi:MAG: MATE family efflux transporter [Bacteroidota bacterium]